MLEEYIKETVKKELAKQKLNVVYGKSNQDLEQENEKLKEYVKLLQEDKDVLLKQVSQQRKELRDSKNGLNGANDIIKNMKQENEKLKESIEKLDGKLILKGNLLSEQKQENEQLKNSLKGAKNKILELSSKDCIINDIHIVQLEDANSKIETIGNMVEKLINESQDLKQENKKLKEKMSIIKGIIHVQHKRTYTNDNLMRTIKLIEDIIKES